MPKLVLIHVLNVAMTLSSDGGIFNVDAGENTIAETINVAAASTLDINMTSLANVSANTFNIGTGNAWAFGPPRYRKSGWPDDPAAAFATARETPRIAFAPSLLLVADPSRSISVRSRPR